MASRDRRAGHEFATGLCAGKAPREPRERNLKMNVNRRNSLGLTGSASIAAALGPRVLAAATGRNPNLVVIMADDCSAREFGCYGQLDHRTPHIDRMAREGVKFETRWCTPIRSPARAQMMTGKYGFRTRWFHNDLKDASRPLSDRTGDNGTGGYGKGQIDQEKGPRVPMVVYGPGRVKPVGASAALANHCDVFATLRDLGSAALRPGYVIDGHSFAPLLAGQPFQERDRKKSALVAEIVVRTDGIAGPPEVMERTFASAASDGYITV